MKLTLPTNSAVRKDFPLLRGLFRYFPAALAGVSNISKKGNDKHNPGEEMHHARGKSMDHGDCILRHTIDLEDILAEIERKFASKDTGDSDVNVVYREQLIDMALEEASQRAWRALADSQALYEYFGRAPLAPGAKV
jgi:hypothetical protein